MKEEPCPPTPCESDLTTSKSESEIPLSISVAKRLMLKEAKKKPIVI